MQIWRKWRDKTIRDRSGWHKSNINDNGIIRNKDVNIFEVFEDNEDAKMKTKLRTKKE